VLVYGTKLKPQHGEDAKEEEK